MKWSSHQAGWRLMLAVAVIFVMSTTAEAKDLYVAQAANGAGNGSSCSNAFAVSWFNSSGSWGNGSNQISPGDTVHLCGTISSTLRVLSNGTAAAPIKILFEPNAKISMPVCNSICIDLTGRSYIEIDGGTNGIIENTANGTNFGNRVDVHGLSAERGSNLKIHGLTIRNLYQYVCCGNNSGGVGVYFYGGTNVDIYDNTFTGMWAGINFQVGNGMVAQNNNIYNNTIGPDGSIGWGIVYAGGDGSARSTSATIHDNDVTNGHNWATGSTNFFHLDPIHTWSGVGSGGTALSGTLIYNNYIHGRFPDASVANTTAGIYIDANSGPNSGAIFNNVIVFDQGHPGDGAIFVNGPGTTLVANNTIDCKNNSGGIGSEYGQGGNLNIAYRNNIIMNCRSSALLRDNASGITFTSSRNNFYNNGTGIPSGDTGSITANPNLTSDYQLQAGSPVIGIGENLTAQGIPALNTSKPLKVGAGNLGAKGVQRPATGGWDLGAHGLAVPRPDPPTNLTILVQ